MPGASVSLGQRVTEIGALQLQINALEQQIAGGGQFLPIVTLEDIVAGNPVAFNGSDDAIQIVAGANNAPANAPVGIAVPTENGGLQVQTGGVATLPIADWNAIIGGVGSSTGLQPGAFYYVDTIAGQITRGVANPISASGSTSSSPVGARIGYAISTTELLVMPGGAPNTLVLPNNGASLGMPVAVDEPSSTVVFTPGQANALASSQIAGLAGYIDGSGNVVCFTAGMVLELTAAEWHAIGAGVGGLSLGSTYYLSNTVAGNIIGGTPPSASGSFAVAIGFALSATKMAITVGSPIGPHA